jgi:hypothetical protein
LAADCAHVDVAVRTAKPTTKMKLCRKRIFAVPVFFPHSVPQFAHGIPTAARPPRYRRKNPGVLREPVAARRTRTVGNVIAPALSPHFVRELRKMPQSRCVIATIHADGLKWIETLARLRQPRKIRRASAIHESPPRHMVPVACRSFLQIRGWVSPAPSCGIKPRSAISHQQREERVTPSRSDVRSDDLAVDGCHLRLEFLERGVIRTESDNGAT